VHSNRLADHLVRIDSGLTPAVGGALSRERRAALNARLDALALSRAAAFAEIRSGVRRSGTGEGENRG